MTTTEPRDPDEVVAIRHPNVEVPGTATRAAAETVWADLGWSIDGDTVPTAPTGDPDSPVPLVAPKKNAPTEEWEAFLTAAGVSHDPDANREALIAAWETAHPQDT